jgi:hypothetical protein
MPWEGEVDREHKITAITISEQQGICELKLKAEGAFNYDPIYFPANESNIINNNGFDTNLNTWSQDLTQSAAINILDGGRLVNATDAVADFGQVLARTAQPSGDLVDGGGIMDIYSDKANKWFHDAAQGVNKLGAASVHANGTERTLTSERYGVNDMIRIPVSAWVKAEYVAEAVSNSMQHTLRLDALLYLADGTLRRRAEVAGTVVGGTYLPWKKLQGTLLVDDEVTEVELKLVVTSGIKQGQVWWDDVEMTL